MIKQTLHKFIDFVKEYVQDERKNKFLEVLEERTNYITVVLEDIIQSQNASAVIRSCDGFGIQNTHIIENENSYTINPLVLKGANQWVNIYKYNQKENNTLDCLNKLKKELRQLTNKKDAQINISEVKRPELNAALVGMNICQQLKKKISYRRVINKAMQATMRMGANGIRINVAGRLGGVEIARSEKYSDGSVPLHTLRANIDYSLSEAHTAYGIIGVKVWICKP